MCIALVVHDGLAMLRDCEVLLGECGRAVVVTEDWDGDEWVGHGLEHVALGGGLWECWVVYIAGVCGLHVHLVGQADVNAVMGACFVAAMAILPEEMACACRVGIG